jgi:hypothetical protein
MLELMLGNAPNAFACGEVYAWFRPHRSHHFEIDCPCGQKPCPYWERVKNGPERRFHRRVLEQFEVDFVVDSSKDICWVIDSNRWARRNGVQAFNLLVWKSPLGLAHSHWKRGWGIVSARHAFVLYYARFFETGLPFLSVSYDELVQDPDQKLEAVCKLVGLDYFPGKERFWEKRQHHLFGSGGVREQVVRANSRIDSGDSLPTAFLQEVKRLGFDLQRDQEVQNILENLAKREVSRQSRIEGALLQDKHESHRGRIQPLWYYEQWIRRIYKRRFPDPWPPR